MSGPDFNISLEWGERERKRDYQDVGYEWYQCTSIFLICRDGGSRHDAGHEQVDQGMSNRLFISNYT